MEALARPLPIQLEFSSLAEKRLWAARRILAAHVFPAGDGPRSDDNDAYAVDGWNLGADGSGHVITRIVAGGPRGLNRPMRFAVGFGIDSAAPVSIDCGRWTLLSSISPVKQHRSVGHNPYSPGHAFDLHVPEKDDPVRITWSFVLRIIHDTALAHAEARNDAVLAQQAAVIDRFGREHGNDLDATIHGMPVAFDEIILPEDLTPDTELGRAIHHCVSNCDLQLLQRGAGWVHFAASSLWLQHGRAIETRFGFSSDFEHEPALALSR